MTDDNKPEQIKETVSQPFFLPTLREDIHINTGPLEEDGSPTWTLYDPITNQYFKLGWFEFECLTRLPKCKTVSELLKKIKKETPLSPSEGEIKDVVLFLVEHRLIHASDPQILALLEEGKEKRKMPLWKKALHSYLYFTIPLLKPQKFLDKTLPFVRPFLTKTFFYFCLCLLGYGIILTIGRIDEFMTTFMNYFNMEGVVLMGLTVIFVKICHELGHAYVAAKNGIPVTTIGVALIVLYPILYTETTNAWRIVDRKKRIQVALAGVMTETCLASFALILWHILPPGLGQSIAFFVAFVSLTTSILVNINPLMRFDGYYFVSDLTRIDNLQERSVAMMKWHLRKLLFGWNDPYPEYTTPERRHFLTVFGVCLVIYRFFLFTGIALIVYHLFFKGLGLILMLIELLWFIGFPILREINVWYQERERIIPTKRFKIFLASFAVCTVLFFIPFYGKVHVPAVLHAEQYAELHVPIGSYIEDVYIVDGQKVLEGELLFKIISPELNHKLKITEQQLHLYQKTYDRTRSSIEMMREHSFTEEKIAVLKKEVEGLKKQLDLLRVKAPFTGYVYDMDPTIKSGRWVNKNELLAVVAQPQNLTISGYVFETDMDRITYNNTGVFYSHLRPFQKHYVSVAEVDTANVTTIFWDELASIYGGDLPSVPGNGTHPIPLNPVYKVNFKITSSQMDGDAIPYIESGFIELDAESTSLFSIAVNKVSALFIKESGL